MISAQLAGLIRSSLFDIVSHLLPGDVFNKVEFGVQVGCCCSAPSSNGGSHS